MANYEYTGNYSNLVVGEQLGEEGTLSGEFGTLHFRRCTDGIAVIESNFLGSGYVCWPTSAYLGIPRFINEQPVTEIHRTIAIDSTYPIAIEAPELKRAYLKIRKRTLEDQLAEDDPFRSLVRLMLRDQENRNQSVDNTFITVEFFCKNNGIEYCEIQCNDKCILNRVNARHLRVKAPYVELLSDRPYRDLERVDFSGRVYPYEDLRGKYLDYFAGLKNLKEVDGALCGKDGWYFEGCSSLENVHLSNGIERVLSRAFKDCSSLTDLYIPDTVTEIGAYAFSGCTSLKTIHLPSDIRIIPKGAFEGCKSLKKVFLSDSIEVIEDDAFKGCSSMRKPWIPKAIKRISETAFDNPEWR